jgi:CO/xanthine dehydrogenase FAD-binding subunit
MKPAPFTYIRAQSAQHAVELLKQHGDGARLLAGGQTLTPMMNLRLSRPEYLIDIGHLPLDAIETAPGSVKIGALVRHRALLGSREVAAVAPIVPQAVRHIAHPTIRNFGTAGGSAAYADPTAEICAIIMLLDGEVVTLAARGGRSIAASDYFVSAFETGLAEGEMITAIHLRPPAGPHGSCFLEVAERKGDYAIAAVGVTMSVKGGIVEEARIVMSGAKSVPVRARAAEARLKGAASTDPLLDEIGAVAVEGADCYADIRASAEYRRSLLTSLVSRAVAQADAAARKLPWPQ